MRPVSIVLALLGCVGEPEDDSADVVGGDTAGVAAGASFGSVTSDCTDGMVCQWSIETAGDHAGAVDLYVDAHGTWREHHWLFTDVSGGVAPQRFQIALDLVADQGDYIENSTTWVDTSLEGNVFTWLVLVKGDDGVVADCAVDGADPSLFSADCP